MLDTFTEDRILTAVQELTTEVTRIQSNRVILEILELTPQDATHFIGTLKCDWNTLVGILQKLKNHSIEVIAVGSIDIASNNVLDLELDINSVVTYNTDTIIGAHGGSLLNVMFYPVAVTISLSEYNDAVKVEVMLTQLAS